MESGRTIVKIKKKDGHHKTEDIERRKKNNCQDAENEGSDYGKKNQWQTFVALSISLTEVEHNIFMISKKSN